MPQARLWHCRSWTSMVPALTAQTRTAANAAPRLGFVYLPHGAIMDRWTPKTEGAGFEFTPILQSLEPFRDQLNIVSGLGHQAADTTAVHSLSPATWLSGVRPKATQGTDAYAGITADQYAAAEDRSGYGAAFDRTRNGRSFGIDWRLRPRLRLHLHEHDFLADTHHSAAHGNQSAKGFRTDVRTGRKRGCPDGKNRGRSKRSRSVHAAVCGFAEETWRSGSHNGERLSGKRS